jgi:hypothetical protein
MIEGVGYSMVVCFSVIVVSCARQTMHDGLANHDQIDRHPRITYLGTIGRSG